MRGINTWLIVEPVTVARSKMNRSAILIVYVTILAIATQETSGVSIGNVSIKKTVAKLKGRCKTGVKIQ
jgi:hypothetical protein